jgi:hypothetical protein
MKAPSNKAPAQKAKAPKNQAAEASHEQEIFYEEARSPLGHFMHACFQPERFLQQD